ncbi:hypothetical protein PIB30_078648 [Stylosanthes scabra]|uniref:Uncharacterized protein n=1 Tax=Stylosanthes scabra TaxID=79078 RepID=A0ABU6XT13_9FABA|nr:hypothetical protein [Stylosanthes scabra]
MLRRWLVEWRDVGGKVRVWLGLAQCRLGVGKPITLPKLTQANLEQARSRLNILKISSQAHTPSSQTSPQVPKLSPLSTQGHGNKDKQSLNFDLEIERTLRKLRKQSKQTHKISSEEVFDEVSDNVTAKEVLEEGCDNMAEAGNQHRTLANVTNPTTASCGSSIVWPTVEANNFELKLALVQLVQQNRFGGSPLC